MSNEKFVKKLGEIVPAPTNVYPIHFHFFENSKKYDPGKIMDEYAPAYRGKIIFTKIW